MSSTNRRSFLARGAALAAVPTVAALATGALAAQASASTGPAGTLPNFAPIPKSALGPAVTAPPTIGHNLQRAIDKIASDNGVSNKVTHIVYSHHTLRVGGERVNLAWRGTNHTADNTYIHFPDHDTLHRQYRVRAARIGPPRPRRGFAGSRVTGLPGRGRNAARQRSPRKEKA